MGRIAAIPFFHPKTASKRKNIDKDTPYFYHQIPTYFQKIFTSIDINLKTPCTAKKVLNPELGIPIMIIKEKYLEQYKDFLLNNPRYLPKFKNLKELISLFRPDTYCMYYLHIPVKNQGSLFLESRFCLLNEEVKITKKIDDYILAIKENFYDFLEEWVGLVINIAAEFIMFKLKKPAIFFNCENCFRPALFIKSPNFQSNNEEVEGQKLWGTANIVDVLMITNIEKYGFDKEEEYNNNLIKGNIIYHDPSFFERSKEVYNDCEYFQRHINGAFILTVNRNSFMIAMKEIKQKGQNEQFDLIVTGSNSIKIIKLLEEYDFITCIDRIFIYTLSPEKYEEIQRKNPKIQKIFFDRGDLIDYIQENKREKEIYQLTKLITYEDYLYKYHILHEMISEQYGKYTEDCYNAAISVIQDFLYWYPKLEIEADKNFNGTKIELLISTLQKFKDISANEEHLIKIYTKSIGSFYKDFNKWLLQLDPFAYKKIAWFIASIMFQLNKYRLNHGITESSIFYRGIEMNFTDLLVYQRCKDKIFCFPSFTSTSESSDVAAEFASNQAKNLEERKKLNVFIVLMIINYKFSNGFVSYAIDTSKCSEYSYEKERLFLPFTFFKLNKIEIDYENYRAFIYVDSIGRKDILETKINENNRLKYNKLGFMEVCEN